jgi:hypothetical protein
MGVLDLYTEQQKKEDKKALQDLDEEEEIDMKNTVPTVGYNNSLYIVNISLLGSMLKRSSIKI